MPAFDFEYAEQGDTLRAAAARCVSDDGMSV